MAISIHGALPSVLNSKELSVFPHSSTLNTFLLPVLYSPEYVFLPSFDG
ncbi:hypothetical protein O2K51_01225 [Apibacter raozihei]|nr:hypothetical protein [Apibacter raozihei]